MMFHVLCQLGYGVGLDAAAKGMGLPGKPEGMNGAMAPVLWAEGKREDVLEYVAQDVRTTLDIGDGVRSRAANALDHPEWQAAFDGIAGWLAAGGSG